MNTEAKSMEAKIYDFIVNNSIATEREINLVTCINGLNIKTLNAIIYVRTSYRYPGQCLCCDPETFKDLNGDFSC